MRPDAAHFSNEYDLGTNQGIHKVIQDIDHYKPKHVWLSPVCGPFSVMQNINQRSEAQKEALSEKRKAAMKQYVGWQCHLGMVHNHVRHGGFQ